MDRPIGNHISTRLSQPTCFDWLNIQDEDLSFSFMADADDEPKSNQSSMFSGIEQSVAPQSISIPLSTQPVLSGEVQQIMTGGSQKWGSIAPVEKKPPSFAWGILIGFILYMFLGFVFGSINALFASSWAEYYSDYRTTISSENSTFTLELELGENEGLESCNAYVEDGNTRYNLWCSWENYGDDRKIMYSSYCMNDCDAEQNEYNEKAIGYFFFDNTTVWFEEPELDNKTINFAYSIIDFVAQEKQEAEWDREESVFSTLCLVMPLTYIGFTVRAYRKSPAYGKGMLTIGVLLSVLPFMLLIAALLLFGF
jgi:hypothetical protein